MLLFAVYGVYGLSDMKFIEFQRKLRETCEQEHTNRTQSRKYNTSEGSFFNMTENMYES